MIEGIGEEIIFGMLVGTLVYVTLFYIFNWRLRDVNILDIALPINGARNILEPPPAYNPNSCPICLSAQVFALETSCGHLYCGACLETHYQVTRDNNTNPAMICPLCRQRVLTIFNCFSVEERGELDIENSNLRNQLLEFIRGYNRLVGSDPTIMERISELPVLLRRFLDHILNRGFSEANYLRLRLILFLLGTLIYIIVPYDLVPEIIFGVLGYTEDAVITFVMLSYIVAMYRNIIINAED